MVSQCLSLQDFGQTGSNRGEVRKREKRAGEARKREGNTKSEAGVRDSGKVCVQPRHLLLGDTLLSLGTADSKSGFSEGFITCSKI